MTLLKRFALILLSLIVTACSMPGLAFLPAQEPRDSVLPIQLVQEEPVLVSAPGDSTATPTPFQPLPPTAVFTPTEIPTLTPVPTATATPLVLPTEIAALVPADIPGQMVIALLGSDRRPGGTIFRTDTIILLVLNTAEGTASLISFPRDLWVNIPGYGQERINTAFFHGFKTLAGTIQSNFGIYPKYYVLINFRSFKQIIDNLGGLDVKVGVPLRDKYTGKGWINIPKGKYHMNADLLLWYARSRKTTNDFARNRRQQEVLVALFEKLVSLDALAKAPDMYKLYKGSVTTNLKLPEMLAMLPLALKLVDTSRIKSYYIGPGEVYDWITPGGAMVLLPQGSAIRKIVQKALKTK